MREICRAEATVVFYDEKTSNEATNMGTKGDHKKNGSEQGKKPAASSGKDAEESNADDYVYLPPGCSLKDPGYNSTSDPDQRVHFVDPKPAKRNN